MSSDLGFSGVAGLTSSLPLSSDLGFSGVAGLASSLPLSSDLGFSGVAGLASSLPLSSVLGFSGVTGLTSSLPLSSDLGTEKIPSPETTPASAPRPATVKGGIVRLRTFSAPDTLRAMSEKLPAPSRTVRPD